MNAPLCFGATADPDIPEAVSFHPTLVKGVVDVAVVGYDCCRLSVRPSGDDLSRLSLCRVAALGVRQQLTSFPWRVRRRRRRHRARARARSLNRGFGVRPRPLARWPGGSPR